MAYNSLKRTLDLPLDRAETRIREELEKEGFGILTEIDVQGTLREKLNVETRPYRILGACDPALAHQALSAEIDVGLLLPCNVVVYRSDDGHGTLVAVLDPVDQLAVTGREDMEVLAQDVRKRMIRALDAL